VSESVADRLAAVLARVEAACHRSGRPPASVRLLAVSKRHPAERIREAYAAGQRDFGENYAQELRDKAKELADLPGLRWHMIGPLQANKAKYVAAVASWFHALDDGGAAAELDRRLPPDRTLDCLVNVNVAGEETKHGVAPSALPGLLEAARAWPRLRVVGLMTLPPWGDPEASRPHFRALRALAAQHGLAELSMGTTDDFEVAVEEGATWVRVGTSIFGPRPA
jgi:pyridoxal phosphate enzyme (YggS family)